MAYEQDNIELVTSAVDCYCCGTDVCRDRRDLPASRRRDSQFCSEYAVHAYDAAGRLGTAALKEQVAMAHEIVPVDFATGGAFDGLFGSERELPLPAKRATARWRLFFFPACKCLLPKHDEGGQV